MKTKTLIIGILALIFNFAISSCTADSVQEEIPEIDNGADAIDKEEIKEGDS